MIKKKQKIDKKQKIVYIGPTIQGVAKKGTVYIGKITTQLEEACKENQALAEFIVPLEDFEKKSKELKNPASALSSFFDEIKKNRR